MKSSRGRQRSVGRSREGNPPPWGELHPKQYGTEQRGPMKEEPARAVADHHLNPSADSQEVLLHLLAVSLDCTPSPTSLIPNLPTHCIPHPNPPPTHHIPPPNPPHAFLPSDSSAKRCCSRQPQDQPSLRVNGTRTLGQHPPIKVTPPTSLPRPARQQLPSSCSKCSHGFQCFAPSLHKSPLSEHFCPHLFVLVVFHCSQSHPSGSANASMLGSPHTHTV